MDAMEFDCRKQTKMVGCIARLDSGWVGCVELHLIITADDFGYSVTRNKGIIDCYTAGAITRASLMVNGVACKEAIESATLNGLPVGMNNYCYTCN